MVGIEGVNDHIMADIVTQLQDQVRCVMSPPCISPPSTRHDARPSRPACFGSHDLHARTALLSFLSSPDPSSLPHARRLSR